MGARRVHLPRREGPAAHRRALCASLSLVLPLAQGGRVRVPHQRAGSREPEVGEGVQSLRPVLQGRRQA